MEREDKRYGRLMSFLTSYNFRYLENGDMDFKNAFVS